MVPVCGDNGFKPIPIGMAGTNPACGVPTLPPTPVRKLNVVPSPAPAPPVPSRDAAPVFCVMFVAEFKLRVAAEFVTVRFAPFKKFRLPTVVVKFDTPAPPILDAPTILTATVVPT